MERSASDPAEKVPPPDIAQVTHTMRTALCCIGAFIDRFDAATADADLQTLHRHARDAWQRCKTLLAQLP